VSRQWEALLGSWQETPSSVYRQLEREQRALARDATSAATRDIHLEFAEKYRLQAEQREADEQAQAPASPEPPQG
jgi:hypothetical protein